MATVCKKRYILTDLNTEKSKTCNPLLQYSLFQLNAFFLYTMPIKIKLQYRRINITENQ